MIDEIISVNVEIEDSIVDLSAEMVDDAIIANVDVELMYKGDKGDPGEKGDKGDPGAGIIAGGTTGQALVKKSNADYDTEWLSINSATWGNITGTLSNQIDLQTALTAKEDATNKVTTLTSSSTNTQYPAAKTVYDITEDIREIAAGKNKNYVSNITKTPALNSQLDMIEVASFITTDDEIITHDKCHRGDNVYVTDANVPDRWVSGFRTSGETVFIQLFKLETAKVPVTDVKINSVSIISNTIANIPFASGANAGVGAVNSLYGINVTGGVFHTVSASNADLETKTQGYKPVVSNNLDKAIMEGLGNNSLTWSDNYKQSARNTIGAGTASYTYSNSAPTTLSEGMIHFVV